ncbi:DNA primase [Candidatus Soleaferrea massiliensis]|uniref:DNA primase n=1 Tax=Candidatus Soleaferrea massiliensis TaxID=1470354 RepID=UPI00058C5366|nr:DNA primase [Candidatus Soleaferrea massiliensis]
MIGSQFIEELKFHCEIEDVVSSYVSLKRGGRNLMGLCPFHSEKTGSFAVFPDTQSFYCFGCGKGGDVITFIEEIEHLSYVEAVQLLAKRAGLEVPDSGENNELARLKTEILEINRQAARFYYKYLLSDNGKAARAYLVERGLSAETVKKFGLGYAPNAWGEMYRHLKGLGYRDEALLSSNIVARGRNGSCYDQFRNRVIFPIIDLRGNVIAFGGRALDQKGPKYLNSSDTPVFKKSRNLFALNIAKASKAGKLILSEGYMDVISIHQGGFDYAVATLGTALTSEQVQLIAQYTNEVILAYDSDEAGQKATKRAVELLDARGLQIRILSIPGAKDPDEYIKKFGSTRFKLLLDGSDNYVEYELHRLRQVYDIETTQGKIDYLKKASKLLSEVNSPVERDVFILKVANELSITKDALYLQVNNLIKQNRRAKNKKERADIHIAGFEKLDKINPERNRNKGAALTEEKLIAVLMKNPDYYNRICCRIRPEDFVTSFNRQVYTVLTERLRQNLPVDLMQLSADFDKEQMARIAGILNASDAHCTTEQADEYMERLLEFKNRKTKEDIAGMDDNDTLAYIASLGKKKK